MEYYFFSISGEINRGQIHSIKSADKNYLHGTLNRLDTISVKLFNEKVLTDIFDNEFIFEGETDQPKIITPGDFSNEMLNRSNINNIYINGD